MHKSTYVNRGGHCSPLTVSGGISKITAVGMGETINNLYFVTGDFTV